MFLRLCALALFILTSTLIDQQTSQVRAFSQSPATVASAATEGKESTEKDRVYRIELPLAKARSREPVLGGSREKVFVQVWLPAGVRTFRGGICNPFSKEEKVSAHWQAACRHWRFAYVQTDFDAVRKEEFGLLEKGLAELAKKSGQPELALLPMCFIGMSRGGGMSMQLSERLPGRTLASAPVCLEVGPQSQATRALPVLTVFGEKDGSQMKKLLEKLPKERSLDARWGIAVQWGRKHEFAQANNLSFVFFDEVIRRRLPSTKNAESPKDVGAPVRLSEIPLEEGWLGEIVEWEKNSKEVGKPVVHPWKDYKGDRARACWFPSERVARVWQAFVSSPRPNPSAGRDILMTEPSGLGDGQRFLLHSVKKPVSVKLSLGAKWSPDKVELWDAERRLETRSVGPWNFEVRLEPGIHSLYAIVYERGQPLRNSRPHTLIVAPE